MIDNVSLSHPEELVQKEKTGLQYGKKISRTKARATKEKSIVIQSSLLPSFLPPSSPPSFPPFSSLSSSIKSFQWILSVLWSGFPKKNNGSSALKADRLSPKSGKWSQSAFRPSWCRHRGTPGSPCKMCVVLWAEGPEGSGGILYSLLFFLWPDTWQEAVKVERVYFGLWFKKGYSASWRDGSRSPKHLFRMRRAAGKQTSLLVPRPREPLLQQGHIPFSPFQNVLLLGCMWVFCLNVRGPWTCLVPTEVRRGH